jgi:hypothetical protein
LSKCQAGHRKVADGTVGRHLDRATEGGLRAFERLPRIRTRAESRTALEGRQGALGVALGGWPERAIARRTQGVDIGSAIERAVTA